ncbi:Serine/threonine-protein kinase Nek3 [Symbiodinium microadriaticum]|uniref:non-specific serine/threonine protein kinase n=1 Tax=Symbiodinium microadriaticum TaxID=2951 RepID=A0A1Q9F337_SYMMI|nr:Serine/threonine-protein kinase Nek3 [Symbiodinium microadriaticum]
MSLQVADAVRFVHAQKMVHRDIKSRNIFLCRTGKALLGDFGLVRLLEMPRLQELGDSNSLPKIIIKGEYEPLGSHYSAELHGLVARMLAIDPAQRLDLLSALNEEVLAAPLRRARDALGLEVPEESGSAGAGRADRIRKEIQETSEHNQSEWIGYNTMIRRKEEGPLVGEAKKGIVDLAEARAPPGIEGTVGPGDWSTAQQRDPDSGEEELASASDDSWGSVVKTGVDALQEIMENGK